MMAYRDCAGGEDSGGKYSISLKENYSTYLFSIKEAFLGVVASPGDGQDSAGCWVSTQTGDSVLLTTRNFSLTDLYCYSHITAHELINDTNCGMCP